MKRARAEESVLERLAGLSPRAREAEVERLAGLYGITVAELQGRLLTSWDFLGRPKQHAPAGDWMFWFLKAGRGFGKTLTAAQWTKRKGTASRCRIALIAPTLGDVRGTMIEGETGILSILAPDAFMGGTRATGYNRSNLEVTLANGTIMKGFSSEEPERLRGPQHHYAWCEEASSWKDANKPLDDVDTTWSNMTLGLRLGRNPQAVITSTPKANKLTKELVAMAKSGAGILTMVEGSSYENRSNLAEAYWRSVIAPLEGKRAGRQEIHAELLDEVEGALWTLKQIDLLRVRPEDVPPLRRIIVAVDPNVSSSQAADAAGIVVAGIELRRDTRRAYVLHDHTVVSGGPKAWASKAVWCYHEYRADRLVAEVNNGGELVEMTIRNLDRTISYTPLHATKGKRIRAEPVAALYEGKPDDQFPPTVFHAGLPGELADLEEEMTTWVPGEDSPNRLDALVWALTELVLENPPGYGSSHVPQGRIPGVEERYGGAVDYY